MANGREQVFVCAATACRGRVWRVRPDPDVREVWRLDGGDAGSWTVAASRPLCPFCGGALALVDRAPGRTAEAA